MPLTGNVIDISTEGSGGCSPSPGESRSVEDNGTIYLRACGVGVSFMTIYYGGSSIDSFLLATAPSPPVPPVPPTVVPPTVEPETPTPTPTPTRPNLRCVATTIEGVRYERARTHTGNWERPCQIFRFPVFADGHVIFDLRGDGLDTELTLHQAEDSQYSRTRQIAYNDDNLESSSSTSDSRLGRTISRGFYVVEARLVRPPTADANKRLSLRIEHQVAVPHDGRHHADRSVFYNFVTPPDDPGGRADGFTFEEAKDLVRDAADRWHYYLAGSWPDIVFCELGDSRHPECRGRNSDSNIVTVALSDHPYYSCGPRTACVLAESDSKEHLYDVALVIEMPPTQSTTPADTTLAWTDDKDRHGSFDMVEGAVYRYIWMPVFTLHEWGHTIGLLDLYGVSDEYRRNYVMGGYVEEEVNKVNPPGDIGNYIPSTDRNYVHQVYRQYEEPH